MYRSSCNACLSGTERCRRAGTICHRHKRWLTGSHMREDCVVRLCQVCKVIADSHLVAAANNARESPRVNRPRILLVCAPAALKLGSSSRQGLARSLDCPSRRTNRRRAHHRARTPVRNYCQRSSTLPRGHRCLEHSITHCLYDPRPFLAD